MHLHAVLNIVVQNINFTPKLHANVKILTKSTLCYLTNNTLPQNGNLIRHTNPSVAIVNLC